MGRLHNRANECVMVPPIWRPVCSMNAFVECCEAQQRAFLDLATRDVMAELTRQGQTIYKDVCVTCAADARMPLVANHVLHPVSRHRIRVQRVV
eukprot:4455092-Alexandrium_andersonii.AAC.1